MAMPMRFVNVKRRIANIIISHRLLSLTGSRFVVASFSNEASKNPVENEDEEDFFGIPNNFKLQHARVLPRGQNFDKSQQNENLQVTTSETQQNENVKLKVKATTSENVSTELNHQEFTDSGMLPDYSESDKSSSLTRRKQRKITETSFGTTFGYIAFDTTMVNASNMGTEDLKLKAQAILDKLNIETIKSVAPSTDKVDQIENRVKEKMGRQDNKIRTSLPKKLDSLKTAHVSNTAKLNYFDEVYFPEQPPDDNYSMLEQKPTQETSVPEKKYTHFSKSQKQVNSSLPKVNIIADSNIAKNSSVKDRNNICPSEQSENWLDEQYFGTHLVENNAMSEQANPDQKKKSFALKDRDFEISVENWQQKNTQVEKQVSSKSLDFNEVDDQYFGDTFHSLYSNKDNIVSKISSVDNKSNSPSLGEIASEYSNHLTLKKTNTEQKLSNKTDRLNRAKKRLDETYGKCALNDNKDQLNVLNTESLSANVTDQTKFAANDKRVVSETSKEQELSADNPILSSEHFLKMRKRTNTMEQPNSDKPETAYDLAMKIRHDIRHGKKPEEKTSDVSDIFSQNTDDNRHTISGRKLDSKGFRVAEDQLPDLDKMTSADIVRMLKSRIIFNHDDFLALDKPYGLPCISQKQDRVSVSELLPALAEHLPQSYKVTDLHLVHSLDRDVTGAIILAKNPEVAYNLRGLYKDSDMVTQRFWAITKGVPNPPAGIIDIPIGEGKVGNIYKMVLRPRFLKDEKQIGTASKASSERAVTHYNIVSSHLQSALVECVLHTDVKHQIRLHLASGLGTPILGDHKYSNFSKLAPQKLHREMLDLLKIRQAKVRNLALHLHCRSVILKDYKGRMIFLTTYPPSHFRDNMSSLRLHYPK